ncbi:MAG: sugar transporter substrate-binding protein, partial [Bacilli bacterium]|nr:sugar transporter substrate-binding protein [Bacilli bacterium]
WAVAVVNNSKRTDMSELAYKFIEFITSKDMELLKIASGNDPTRISNYKRNEVAASNPIYPVLAESLANAKVLADLDVPFVTEKLNKIEENAIQSVIWNKATPEAAINQMAAEFKIVTNQAGLTK